MISGEWRMFLAVPTGCASWGWYRVCLVGLLGIVTVRIDTGMDEKSKPTVDRRQNQEQHLQDLMEVRQSPGLFCGGRNVQLKWLGGSCSSSLWFNYDVVVMLFRCTTGRRTQRADSSLFIQAIPFFLRKEQNTKAPSPKYTSAENHPSDNQLDKHSAPALRALNIDNNSLIFNSSELFWFSC